MENKELAPFIPGKHSPVENFENLLNCPIWIPSTIHCVGINQEEKKLCGSFQVGVYYYQIVKTDSNVEVVLCNKEDKSMRVWRGDCLESCREISCDDVQHSMIIDLDRDGSRWEGDAWNYKPFGYGCLYNKNGNLVYEGFYWENKYTCVGKSYYANENPEYEGSFVSGNRAGQGICYDLSGQVDYQGLWAFNCGISSQFTFPVK